MPANKNEIQISSILNYAKFWVLHTSKPKLTMADKGNMKALVGNYSGRDEKA
jgi:hypothetical protein